MKSCLYFLLLLSVLCCKPQKVNDLIYHQKVVVIDSIYRMRNDTLRAQKLYTKLFRKYRPHQTELIEEYETYLRISDRYHKDFGAKRSLYKLIPLAAPNWRYKKQDPEFFKFYKKYGIDSLTIEGKIAEWKSNLNKSLVDSFKIARIRDQELQRTDGNIMRKNDRKNAQLLIWTFVLVILPCKKLDSGLMTETF